ncbi:hypothetical protein [Calothrix sp. 336/3]|uniref:hypothetical protein n=1 Tax=Calothrix sp. 336/3 TaxID=1337936 RepID=UPI0004E3D64B|nr:hypothetical protein [Calothrix sp. 336/3]AKG24485.1 hypothetical protein IJ00_06165 [Calothrix sp. 336/3]
MSSTKLSLSLSMILASLVNLATSQARQRKTKVYDCTEFVCGQDYVLETTDDGSYITAQFRGVKAGDHIILNNGSGSQRYRVEEIDYYSEPSDMWTALLKVAEEIPG